MGEIKTIKEIASLIKDYAASRNDIAIQEIDLHWKEVPNPADCKIWIPKFPADQTPQLIPEPKLKPFLKIKLIIK